jgi:hypothetical protein
MSHIDANLFPALMRQSTVVVILIGSWGTHGRVVGWDYATSRKVAGSIPDEFVEFFNWPNFSSHTVALGSTQPLTEMSTRILPGSKGRPARKVDNFTAISGPIVYKMWVPRRLTTLWASTASYRDSFTSLPYVVTASHWQFRVNFLTRTAVLLKNVRLFFSVKWISNM